MIRRLAIVAFTLALVSSATLSASARAQRYYRPLPEQYYRGPRVRFHAEGEIGGGGAGRGLGLGASATIGIGLQVNDIVAGYAQHRALFGERFDGSRGAFVHSYNSFLLDLTLFESVQIGAGPSIDLGIGSLCAIDANPEAAASGARECAAPSGPHVGLDVRLALMLGSRTHARRRGPVIAAHLHPTWLDRSSAVVTLTLGAGFALQ